MAKGLPRSLRNAQFNLPSNAFQKLTLPVKAVPLTVAAAGAGIGFGSVVIGDFPEGDIFFFGGIARLRFRSTSANLVATFTPQYSVGRVPTAAGALTTTEADLIPSTLATIAVAGVTPVSISAASFVTTTLGAPVYFDNRDGSLEMNLNAFVLAADITDATSAIITVEGVVHLAYLHMGDDSQ